MSFSESLPRNLRMWHKEPSWAPASLHRGVPRSWSGGGFVWEASQIRSINAGSVGLVICHHVFSVHLVALPGCNVRGMHPGFDHIWIVHPAAWSGWENGAYPSSSMQVIIQFGCVTANALYRNSSECRVDTDHGFPRRSAKPQSDFWNCSPNL